MLMSKRQLQKAEVMGLVEAEKITLKAWNELRPWDQGFLKNIFNPCRVEIGKIHSISPVEI